MGGHVVDSPGLREIGLWQIPADELAWCYPDLRPYLGTCRFSDCAHGPEPGCAVTAAVVSGAVSDARFDSYRRLVGASSRAYRMSRFSKAVRTTFAATLPKRAWAVLTVA